MGISLCGCIRSRCSGTQDSNSCKEVGAPLSPLSPSPSIIAFRDPSCRKPSWCGCKEQRQRPAPCPHPHCVALEPPHLSVPLIGDSLDLNLFPPHLLRGSSVPGRGGDRWVAGLGTPHTVLMNGLGPVLSSWSAGQLLHSLLGGEGHGKTVSPSNPQPCSLGTLARSTAPLGEAVSVLKMRTGWQPEGTACHSQAQAGPRTQNSGSCAGA